MLVVNQFHIFKLNFMQKAHLVFLLNIIKSPLAPALLYPAACFANC